MVSVVGATVLSLSFELSSPQAVSNHPAVMAAAAASRADRAVPACIIGNRPFLVGLCARPGRGGYPDRQPQNDREVISRA
ncbi:MAG: hypothetical protein AB1925_06260 [Actinomycetota bacterium]